MGTPTSRSTEQSRRVAELHDALTQTRAHLTGVHATQAWAGLGYPDWDTYTAAEVLPRLLQHPADRLLRPAWDAYRPQHVGSDLDQAVHGLLDRAGRLLLDAQPATLTRWDKPAPFGVRDAPPELVTEADLAVQDLLLAGLRELLGPNIGVYAEEGHTALDALEKPVCVVLDPLEQTRALLAGRREYSVNLAVIDHGQITGYTDFPALGWRFHTTPEALWFNGRELHLASPSPDTLTVATDPASVNRLPDHLPDGRRLLAHPCDGIAYPLALLALGLVQAVWLPPTPAPRFWVWEVLSMAAGLRHLDAAAHGWGRDQDLTKTRPPVWAGGLLAATPDVREQLRKALPDHRLDADRDLPVPSPRRSG